MQSRRKFLQTAGLGFAIAQSTTPLFAANLKKKTPSPLVLATWNNHKACNAAWQVLQQNKRALDAIEEGLHVPEADPEDTSVGYGGNPDRDGNVTLDACIMDEKGNAGSVTYLQHIMHPISVARLVMEKTPHVLLSGEGALQFALSQGFTKENLLTERAKNDWLKWCKETNYQPIIGPDNHDTCGMLAIDFQGNMSGGCTTSGAKYKMAGRVGDSPIIGAGLFVDNEIGGATGTGWGELALRTLGSFLIVEQMRNGKSPQKACEIAVKRIVDKYGTDNQMCYIAADKKGRIGAFSVQKGFEYFIQKDGEAQVIKSDFYKK